jgi:hypothetical protein
MALWMVPGFDELLRSAKRPAVHLEMRDSYGVVGEPREMDPESDYWRP